MIDIVEIKNADYLKFYIEDSFVYCENIKTEEKVIVAKFEDYIIFKKYLNIINNFMEYLDKNKLMLNNPAIFDFYLAIKEVQ